MPQGPDIRQYLDQAMQLGVLTRAQAQKMTKDLVREGQLAQERAQSYVDELIERSRKRTEDLVDLVRKEVRSQIASLGIATKDDIARLETRISQVSTQAATAARSASGAATTSTGTSTTSTPSSPAATAKKATKAPAAKKAKKATGTAATASPSSPAAPPATATLPGTTDA